MGIVVQVMEYWFWDTGFEVQVMKSTGIGVRVKENKYGRTGIRI